MIERIKNFFNRLADDGEMSREELLWGALLVGLLFATVHLITMLVTRWGDHKATSKSLIFSIIVHISFAAGVVVVNPPNVQAKREEKKKPPEPFIVKSVTVDGIDSLEVPEAGNTPIWKRLSDPVKVAVTRQEREPRPPIQPPSVLRAREQQTRPDFSVPKMNSRPEEPVATPDPQSVGRPGPLQQVQIPLRITEKTARRRIEEGAPSTLKRRHLIDRPEMADRPVARSAAGGNVDQPDQRLSPKRLMAINDAGHDPAPVFKGGPAGARIQFRRGPAPAPSIDEYPGQSRSVAGQPRSGASPRRMRPGRIPTRPQTGHAAGEPLVQPPGRIPQTPNPIINRRVAVRDGIRVPIPRTGLVPNVRRPDFSSPRIHKAVDLPQTYQLRSLKRRRDTAKKFGGTDASEKAVELSLVWLARHQHPRGYWDADAYGAGRVRIDENGIDRLNAGQQADTSVTALAVLAFLGAGHTQFDSPFADNIDRALQWLVAQQRSDGFLGGKATHYAQMYCHAMATYALAEAEVFRQAEDPTLRRWLRQPLRKAVDYILRSQNRDDGGWRYRPYFRGQKGDMSIFGWMLMTLKSAEKAGIEVNIAAKRRMVQFLNDRGLGTSKGLAGYRPDLPPTPSMTAEALFCKQLFRIPRNNPAVTEAVAYLADRLPSRSQYDLYYWYYGTLAMYQHHGEPWRKWNRALRDLLVDDQRRNGDAAGSWDPKGRWGKYGGRVYSTALSTLCLEVYYRYRPRAVEPGSVGNPKKR